MSSWKDSAGAWLRPFLPYVLLSVAVMLFLKYAPESMKPWHQTPGPVTVAQPPKEIIRWRVKEVIVQGPERIVTLDKKELAVRLKWPELASLDNGTNVLSAVNVSPSASRTTAVTTLGPSGQAQTLLRVEPMPFFQVKREFSVNAKWLFLGHNLVEAEVRINPLRVGPVEIVGAVGVEVRRDDQSFGPRAYVGAEYRF